MKILALDSTAKIQTVAILEDEKLLASYSLDNGNSHSETLLPMIESSLKMLKLKVDDIDVFTCPAGPGSFTGVRIGVATIKGLAFGRGKKCVAVSALRSLAYNLLAFEGAIICPCMDARRNELYNALFTVENGELHRLCEDRAINVFDLEEDLKKYADKKIYLVGDGYDIAKSNITKVNIENTPIPLRLQSAYSVGMLAYMKSKKGLLTTDIEISPTYLRLSQAERERNERTNNKEN